MTFAEKVLNKTQSLCPICHKPIEAFYVEEDQENREEPAGSATCEATPCESTACGTTPQSGKVFFVKECPEHGVFKTLAAENAKDYKKWIKNQVINIPPKGAMTEGDPDDNSCPLHCGTCENHLQTACCVLIDLTDRCNQHCPYCFARSEMDADRSGESTLADIEDKYDLLLELGEERPFNIQLSGGEPTVRDDLPQIIKLARDKGFDYVQINTNGRRLALEDGYANILKGAGATVIFMQFDGTRDDIYEALRGESLFELKKKAIRNCEKAGLAVTLVPTIVEGVNTDNIGEMMDFLVENVNVVKGIHFQPVSFFGRHPEKVEGCAKGGAPEGEGAVLQAEESYGSGDFPGRITMFELLRKLEEQRPDFKYEDFCPISTGHTLCCFYSTYTREPDGSIKCMLTSKDREDGVSCCDATGDNTVVSCREASNDNDSASCCGASNGNAVTGCCETSNNDTPAGCCENTSVSGDKTVGNGISCCDMTNIDELEVIKKDRDYVLNKWEIAERTDELDEDFCCGESDDASEQIMDMDEFLRYYRQNTFTVTGMAFQDIMNLDAERVKRCRVQVLSEDNKLIPFCAYNTIYR